MICAVSGVWLAVYQQVDRSALRGRLWRLLIGAALLIGIVEVTPAYIAWVESVERFSLGTLLLCVPIVVMCCQLAMQLVGLKERRRLTTA